MYFPSVHGTGIGFPISIVTVISRQIKRKMEGGEKFMNIPQKPAFVFGCFHEKSALRATRVGVYSVFGEKNPPSAER
jgi:hypothetical protein